MNLQQRSNQSELLDRKDIPFADIRQNMRELEVINTWLGGHAITLAGFRQLANGNKRLHICEIGCGGGDNLLAIRRWCHQRKIAVQLTGIDINPDCIRVAKDQLSKVNSAIPSASSTIHDHNFITADYRDVHFDERPDIIFSSLFCHHFTEAELVQQLQWMQQQSRLGFFINDLHRHPLAYHSIQWITQLFSRSYLVKNDAPLSVARGFVKKEWELLLHTAGITNFCLQWKWAFRWLIVVRK